MGTVNDVLRGGVDKKKNNLVVTRPPDKNNEEAIFNPWCSSYTLIEWMRKKCNCDEDVTIDLVDLDGQITNLSGRTKEYANELVTGRGTYILIRVEKLQENGQYHYTSLLNNLEDFNPDLMIKLNSLSRPQSKGKAGRPKAKKNQSKLRQESASKRPPSSERKKPPRN